MGALLKHVVASDPDRYSPANIHFGLLDPIFFENLDGLKKDELRKSLALQASQNFILWKNSLEL
jgi:folate-dependent tRNA-U54 methylase TrmFO/GidA